MPQKTSQSAVPQENPVLARDVLQMVPSGLDEAGTALFLIGKELQQLKDDRDTAAAQAGYLDILGNYEREISGLDPRDEPTGSFLPRFQQKQAKINRLMDGMSVGARAKMKNFFEVRKKQDELDIAKYSLDRARDLTYKELPIRMETSVANGVFPEEFDKELDDIPLLTPEQRALGGVAYRKLFDKKIQESKESAFEKWFTDVAAAEGMDEAITQGMQPKKAAEFGLSIKDTEPLIKILESRIAIGKQREKEQFEIETNQVNAQLIEDTYINKVKDLTDILHGVSEGYLTAQQGETHIKLRTAEFPINLNYDVYGPALDIVNQYNSSELTMKQARNNMLPLLRKLPENVGKSLYDEVSNPTPDWLKTPQGLLGNISIKAFYEEAIKEASGPEEKAQWAQTLSYALRDWAIYNRQTEDTPEERGNRMNAMLSSSLTPSMTRKFFESVGYSYGKMKATPRTESGIIDLEVVPTEPDKTILYKDGKSYDVPIEKVEEALNVHGFTREK